MCGHEEVAAEGPGISEVAGLREAFEVILFVRPLLLRNTGDEALMFDTAMARGVNHENIRGARDRLCIDVESTRVHVAKEDAVLGSVRIHGPEMVVVHLASVDIFPAHVENTSIRQGPGRVVMLDIGREETDVFAVRFTAMDCRDLSQPAVDPAPAAR